MCYAEVSYIEGFSGTSLHIVIYPHLIYASLSSPCHYCIEGFSGTSLDRYTLSFTHLIYASLTSLPSSSPSSMGFPLSITFSSPLGIGLYAYWFVGSLLVISAFNTHLLDFYFLHTPNTWLWSPNYWIRNLPPPNVKITFIDFCQTKFGATIGLEVASSSSHHTPSSYTLIMHIHPSPCTHLPCTHNDWSGGSLIHPLLLIPFNIP